VQEVLEHQRQIEKLREAFTYSSVETWQDLDSKGNAVKTETLEHEDIFVNGHLIERTVKRNDRPLDQHEEQKETDRVTKLIEKAQKTPPDRPLEGSEDFNMEPLANLANMMNFGSPRREIFRGRPTIVVDFMGRKDAKAHGLMENASKKVKGTVWIDEADREVAHIEATFMDDFKLGGGLLANIHKGTNLRYDEAPVNGVWLPTDAEGILTARVLLVRARRQHWTERDFHYKRFTVDAQQGKDAKAVVSKP
jgi:hypothetical protein